MEAGQSGQCTLVLLHVAEELLLKIEPVPTLYLVIMVYRVKETTLMLQTVRIYLNVQVGTVKYFCLSFQCLFCTIDLADHWFSISVVLN